MPGVRCRASRDRHRLPAAVRARADRRAGGNVSVRLARRSHARHPRGDVEGRRPRRTTSSRCDVDGRASARDAARVDRDRRAPAHLRAARRRRRRRARASAGRDRVRRRGQGFAVERAPRGYLSAGSVPLVPYRDAGHGGAGRRFEPFIRDARCLSHGEPRRDDRRTDACRSRTSGWRAWSTRRASCSRRGCSAGCNELSADQVAALVAARERAGWPGL